LLSDTGRLEEADQIISDLVVHESQALGINNRRTLGTKIWWGLNLLRQRRLGQAQQLLEDVLNHHNSAVEHDLEAIGFTEEQLGRTYIEQRRFVDGTLLLQSALERTGRAMGKGHPDTLMCMQHLADGYRRAEMMDQADGVERDIAARRERGIRDLEEGFPEAVEELEI
jgi:hypothetical protein